MLASHNKRTPLIAPAFRLCKFGPRWRRGQQPGMVLSDFGHVDSWYSCWFHCFVETTFMILIMQGQGMAKNQSQSTPIRSQLHINLAWTHVANGGLHSKVQETHVRSMLQRLMIGHFQKRDCFLFCPQESGERDKESGRQKDSPPVERSPACGSPDAAACGSLIAACSQGAVWLNFLQWLAH